MIATDTLIAYMLACVLTILAPGPDNLLAMARGLSQGRLAALISSLGAGAGVSLHVIAASLGLAVVLQTSVLAFTAVKIAGAGYLIYLGIQAIRSRNLISITPSDRVSYGRIFQTGFLTSFLNPKPIIFIMAFIPQFVDETAGQVLLQSLLLGGLMVTLAVLIFTLLGCFATVLASWLSDRPRAVLGLNIGAGSAFIAAGVSIAGLER